MEISEAANLIRFEEISGNRSQTWADLGCGSGTFTKALASLLPAKSIIHAVDSDRQSLKIIPVFYGNAEVKKHHSDFYSFDLPGNLDGILMGNSLHYVKNKNNFIKIASKSLAPSGCFLIVEYDTNNSNAWIPFPINFISLKILFREAGFQSIEKINERPSVFRRENIYSALIRQYELYHG